MTRKVHLIGKVTPIWIIMILLLASGAGVAVGTILQGNVVGNMPIAVSQPLLVGFPVKACEGSVNVNDFVDNSPHLTVIHLDELHLTGFSVSIGMIR